MRIGKARMRPVVEQACVEFPPAVCYDDAGPADYAGEAHWLYPRFINPDNQRLKFSHHAWLIEAGGKRILVDPCVGNLRDRPGADFYHMLDTPWLERLAALGARPRDIDYVFCTHLHVDHVGWNTRLEDGRYVPTFANARYLLPRAENDFWKLDLEGALPGIHAFNAGIYAECVLPVIEAGLADFVDEGDVVAGCMRLIDTPGHTPGHMAGVLESGGQGAVLCGDAIHHPIHVIHPERPGPQDDWIKAGRSRRGILDLCADRDYWLAPAHFQPPHVCKVRRDGGGYRLEWPETAIVQM